MSKRFAIIIVVLLGIYAVVSFFQSDAEVTSSSDPMNASMNTDDMMKDMQDDMSDAKSDMMMDDMDDMADMADDQMSKEQETRKLLAELKTIPVSEFAVNKMKYERLLEMHPGNERFMSKVDFYSQKLADQQAGY
ncbi:MAG: hypothetical protein HN835_05485 [Rhodobiaceae bacterium]|nr:hypothetical protein [Rhodobiaceae bacterium]